MTTSSSTTTTTAMSPSITIPTSHQPHSASPTSTSSSSTTSSLRSLSGSSYNRPPRYSMASTSSSSASTTPTESDPKPKNKGKAPVTWESQLAQEGERWASSPFRRRPSMMGAGLEKTEHIVVDVGGPDHPRLISCVSSSQGFNWNRAIFLPRHMTGQGEEELEIMQDPIEDVVVSEEEAKRWLPQW